MDLSMPVMNGWEALEKIRENPDTAHVPVIAVSAHDPDSQDWRAAGFSDYLMKPCTPSRMIETVRKFLPPPSEDP